MSRQIAEIESHFVEIGDNLPLCEPAHIAGV
jgi:hypothetical protein